MRKEKYYSLTKICKEALDSGKIHISEKKPHEYFIKIAEAAGFDKELLKAEYGKRTQYLINEADSDFVIELINKYAEDDFRYLRRLHYEKMSDETKEYLINGFGNMLLRKGVPFETILKVKTNMRNVMGIELSRGVASFDSQLNDLGLIKERVLEDTELATVDRSLLLCYLSGKIKDIAVDFENVYSNYRNIRNQERDAIHMSDENYEFCDKEKQKLIEIELTDALSREREYQYIIGKCMTIAFESMIRYVPRDEMDILNRRLWELRNRIVHGKYDGRLKGDTIDNLIKVKLPLEVLRSAIEQQRIQENGESIYENT